MAAGALTQLQQAHSQSHSHSPSHHGGVAPGTPGSQVLGAQLGTSQSGVLHQQQLLHLRPIAAGGPDTLRRLLAELVRSTSNQEALALRKYVEEESRDLAGEAFTRFLDNLYDSIQSLLASDNVHDNVAAVRAIHELVDVRLGDNAAKIARLAGHLRDVFEAKRDFATLEAASAALGHIALEGGAHVADIVELQVNQALRWLQGERVESKRFAAALILKEMAENAPTVFNVHVPEFIDAVWFALRDPNITIRERAVQALRACLSVIEKRETRWRVQWYYRMFEATQEGLRNASVESIHGSLLAVGELLRNTGEFMMSRYKEVAAIVFTYRDNRDKLVRRSITALLPRIAGFLRDRFINSYLEICMNYLMAVMKNPIERDGGFDALGEMAGFLGPELKTYLPTICNLLREAIAPRRGKPSLSAIACIGCLAESMKSDMEDYVRTLLDQMFAAGLSTTLVASLNKITLSIDSLLPKIQENLLETISYVLAKTPYRAVKGVTVRSGSSSSLQAVPDIPSPALTQLALRTLTEFNLKGHELLQFARECVVGYLEDKDPVTRREAAICCCRLVEHSVSTARASGASSRLWATQNARGTTVGDRRRRFLIEEILEKLLVAGVADEEVDVRRAVFESLAVNGSFEIYLAQADTLRSMIIALNDEELEIRELAILMSGRLAEKNPAYVLPALRKHLLQLLRDLEQSAESKSREESAKQLGGLIKACERLMVPYITPVLKILISKLGHGSAGSGNSAVVTEVLATIGDLARVGGLALRKDIPNLMPLIVEALVDSSSNSKREVAVATLGDIVEFTGYVVDPYTDHPQLLGVLLRMLNGELAWSTRREVLKVLGIIGALDPHVHKRNLRRLQNAQIEAGSRGTGVEAGPVVLSVEELPVELWQSNSLPSTSDEYYPTVAINSLMRILREPSMSSYHLTVVRSLMYIFKALGLASVPYLPKVMPDLFQIVRVCEEGLREYIFVQLARLVFIVKQHIRKYLDDIRALVSDYWSTMILPVSSRPNAGSPILNLVEQLSLALRDEFRVYLPELLPRCVQILTDAERSGDYTCVLQVLHTFEVFGGSLDDHMHLLLPVLIRLFAPDISDAPVEIQQASLRTVARLLPSMQVSGHISNLYHPLARILDGEKDELRIGAVDALCSLAIAVGSDFSIFVSSVRKLMQRHHIQHMQFDEVECLLRRREPVVVELPFSPVVPSLIDTGDVRNVPGNSFHGLDSEADRHDLEGFDASGSFRSLKVNDVHLRTVWETSKRSTKEDWLEWMRHFSVELLKESPSPALRTCAGLAQVQPYMARELFAAGFVSCWVQLSEASQNQLLQSLNNAFLSPNIPPEILAAILNLAEFMEQDEKKLNIDIRTLGGLAEKCHAYAKALHYKEMEFEAAKDGQRSLVVESLIHINNQLNHHEAAIGILTYAQQILSLELKESWYEKLQRWEDALKAYDMKLHQVDSPHEILECTLGKMRCLAALAQWENLSELCRKAWAEPSAQKQIAPLAASAAWNMGRWDEMSEYVRLLGNGDDGNFRLPVQTLSHAGSSGSGASDGAFFRAVLHVRHGEYDEARSYIEKARKSLATEVAAVVLESYERAYSSMVRIQQLAELEEVIDYSTLKDDNDTRKSVLRKMWAKRIHGTKRKVEVWQALLSVRTLVLPPDEDLGTWIKFSSLCRKSGRREQARQTLVKLMKYDPEISSPDGLVCVRAPEVMLAYFKYQWSLGEESKRRAAFHGLEALCVGLDDPETRSSNPALMYQYGNTHNGRATLLARMYVKLGAWQWVLSPGLEENAMLSILAKFKHATDHSRTWAKAWHKWAYFNTEVINRYTRRGSPVAAKRHVVAAVSGYFESIANASSSKCGDESLQDILRLLTLWFTHGEKTEVQGALEAGLQRVNIDIWLAVLPQIIARIHCNIPAVRELIQSLLVNIGGKHPQALMYPLLVACKSISPARRDAALLVMDKIRQNNGILVDQAQLVSRELIRVAILWHEMWHEALEEASRLYFGEHKVDGMLNVLKPLHEMLNKDGPVTAKEESFVQDYGHELQEANECCNKYRRSGKEAELTQAWDLYYQVFKRINKQLPSLTTLELQHVSPALVSARDLELAVPGTYRAEELVTIREFSPQLIVITSKQRPRKLTIHGSDGVEYTFLLKGHEDLRQDERVMQLFGLVNTLLSNARSTAEKDLSIQRYAVIPLSPNSGLIGWVPNCDTLHHLIREYREPRKIMVNLEHKLMLQFAPDYEHLTLIAKIEVFEHALENTVGEDLAKVLWLKSRSCEVWLDRRTNYTRSLAVMSMVGYLLGLGDRHPSNLMLDRFSGKILHIDFGDCFEASMIREKFPERVPFRLTRMLVKAMEVSGIEGNFRLTCEKVMQVLRSERDSVMAMMEAFVHDPLINWRLFNLNEGAHGATASSIRPPTGGEQGGDEIPSPPGRVLRERELREAVGQLGDANEVLNERAVQVMDRMKHKLTGRDFVIPSGGGVVSPGAGAETPLEFRDTEKGLEVTDQVQKLIAQATSHENLCQSYVGWCPFW